MYTTAIVTTLSLLSVLGPASAEGHWHKRHAHPAKVVVTDVKTVVVEAGQPTAVNPPSNQPIVHNNAVVNNNVYSAPPAKPTSSSKAAVPYTSTSTQAAGSYPTPTGSTGGSGNNPGKGIGGTVTFHNNCDFDVWLWISNGLPDGQRSIGKIAKKTSYPEPKHAPACDGCGTCYKVSSTSELLGGKTLQFEYSINTNTTQQFNDISFVDCAIKDGSVSDAQKAKNCPGYAQGLGIKSPSTCIRQISCPPNTYCPTEAYYVDTPVSKMGLAEPNYTCGDNSNSLDTDFIMCGSGKTGSKRSIAGRLEVDDSL